MEESTQDAEGGDEKDKKSEDKDDKSETKEGDEEGGKSEISDEQLELQKKAKEYLEAKAGGGDEEGRGKKRKRSQSGDDSDASDSGTEQDDSRPPGKEKEEDEDATNGDNKDAEEDKEMKDGDKADDGDKMEEDDGEPKPRPLHKTSSIFLRNLAPTITKQEIEAMCKRYPGFLRAAIADPLPERRWFRRGWVTFERDVKIKDICYNLNNIRLRDCELGPIVNRDLTRRIRTVSAITADKKVVRNDIKLAAKVIINLDKRWNLWQKSENGNAGEEEKKEGTEEENLGLSSTNPVLENITDYLIEEMSAEEEELLGRNNDLEDGEEGEEGKSIARDEELIKVLDRMLLYLRIVHSVDFYNHSEYPNEDEMPNRCGIMHVRSQAPTTKVTPTEIEDYNSNFEKKMGSFLHPKTLLTDDEAAKLGMKNEKDEVEKFIQVNTQELGKDKWLCPLSGKKFKGPDFVRKHIFNKHGEKIEEVKKEVQYYNSYLKDPKRPQLPENPENKGMGGPGHRRKDGPASR